MTTLQETIDTVQTITFTCWRCGKEVVWTAEDLAQRGKPGESLYDFRARMKCSKCKAKWPHMKQRNKYGLMRLGNYAKEGE
jgi:DNA-directed RNA polymerase subunit RPC12/RpoP